MLELCLVELFSRKTEFCDYIQESAHEERTESRFSLTSLLFQWLKPLTQFSLRWGFLIMVLFFSPCKDGHGPRGISLFSISYTNRASSKSVFDFVYMYVLKITKHSQFPTNNLSAKRLNKVTGSATRPPFSRKTGKRKFYGECYEW